MVLFQSTGNSTIDEIAVVSGAATPGLVIEWAVLFAAVLLFTSLRTFARAQVSGFRALSWDDYLVWVAVVLYAALTVNVYYIGVTSGGLATDGISSERRAALAEDPDGQEFRLRRYGAMAQAVKLIIYALILWTLKVSLLYFFAVRLIGEVPGANSRILASLGLLLVTFLGCLASLFMSCRPLTKMWQIFPDPGIMCQASISPLIISIFLACNVVSDLYLVSMPVPLLIRAPLKNTHKAILIGLFSCNILITGMAIVRAYFIIKDPWGNSEGMWEIRETFVALLTTNIPLIAPLLRRMGRSEKRTTSERVEAATNRGSRRASAKAVGGGGGDGSPPLALAHSASKHSVRAQARAKHNEAMHDAYLSEFARRRERGRDDEYCYYRYDGTDMRPASSSASTARTAVEPGPGRWPEKGLNDDDDDEEDEDDDNDNDYYYGTSIRRSSSSASTARTAVEPGADVELEKGLGDYYGPTKNTSRSSSKASTARTAVGSGLDTEQEKVLDDYYGTNSSRCSSRASSTRMAVESGADVEEPGSSWRQDSRVLTGPRRKASSATVRSRDEDAAPQTVHELV